MRSHAEAHLWPSDVGLSACLCCYKSCHLSDSAAISPLRFGKHALQRDARQHVGGSAHTTPPRPDLPVIKDRAQPLHWGESFSLQFINLSQQMMQNFYSRWKLKKCFSCCQENEATDGLYSLFSLDLKRESGDFIFRRPLSKCSSKQWCHSVADLLNSVNRLGKQQQQTTYIIKHVEWCIQNCQRETAPVWTFLMPYINHFIVHPCCIE